MEFKNKNRIGIFSHSKTAYLNESLIFLYRLFISESISSIFDNPINKELKVNNNKLGISLLNVPDLHLKINKSIVIFPSTRHIEDVLVTTLSYLNVVTPTTCENKISRINTNMQRLSTQKIINLSMGFDLSSILLCKVAKR